MSTPQEARPSPKLNVILFLATIATVAGMSAQFFRKARDVPDWAAALTFSFLLLPILLCHEMGHYLLGRIHRMAISLPYFIPLPLGFGTLGAVIFIRSRFPNRNALIDVGAAGPLAGAAVAIAVFAYGAAHAEIVALPPAADSYGSSLLSAIGGGIKAVELIAARGFRAWLETQQPGELLVRNSVLTQWIITAVRGPLPAGYDITISPALLASSAILIITMLNLLPLGQLDGGHVAYAFLGRRHASFGRMVLMVMVALGVFFWIGWLIWALLGAFLVRVDHPPVIDEQAPMTPGRILVAVLCLALLVLTFSPAPVEFITL